MGGLLLCLPWGVIQGSRVCNPIQDLTGQDLLFPAISRWLWARPETAQPEGVPGRERSCFALLWVAVVCWEKP